MNGMFFSLWFAPLLSFAVTFFLLHWLLGSGIARVVLDEPNLRSLHASPVPRVGGLALMGGILAGWGVLPLGGLGGVLLIAALLALLSFLDDVRGLAAGWRLLAHFLAAAGFVAWLLPGIGLLSSILAVLATMWMINLYNFMDGSDGMAGGMAVLGFGFYGLAAGLAGDGGFASANLAIAASAGGVLVFNFYPAKVFMGDVGSIPLGFFAASLGLLGWQNGLWPLWFPVLVFSPFIVDATVTLVKRLLRKERVWQAHREHYYQRLVRMGYGHRNTALLGYVLMAITGAAAVWSEQQSQEVQLALLVAWAAIYLAGMRVIDVKWQLFSEREKI